MVKISTFISAVTITIVAICVCFRIRKTKKVFVNDIIFSGLSNRLFGISSSFILSQLSHRKLFLNKYEYVKDYIDSNAYLNPIKYVSINYTLIQFMWEGYCDDICDFYNNLFKSSKSGYVIIDVLDLIPTLLKCKKLLKWFKKNKYIKDIRSSVKEKIYQTNSKIFSNVVVLKKRIRIKVLKYVESYNSECKIGLHYRSNDGCIISNHCDIENSIIERIINVVNNLTRNKKCWLFISSANSILYSKLSYNYNKTVLLWPNVIPKHSAKVYDNRSIEKTVGDIIFASMTDYLIVNDYSTYSKLVLYMFFKNKKYEEIKNRIAFINENGEIINNERYTDVKDNNKLNKCIRFPHIL